MAEPRLSHTVQTGYGTASRPIDMRDNFLKFYHISFGGLTTTKQLSGYEMTKELKSLIGKEPVSIEAEGKNSIIVKVASRNQGDKIRKVKSLCGQTVKVEIHSRNFTQALIYISHFDVEDPNDLLKYLKEQDPNVYSIKHADFIKTRSDDTKAYIIDYLTTYIPQHLYLGETIAVRPWINRPLRCKQCHKYGHSKGSCKSPELCSQCLEAGHDYKSCQAEKRKCHYCTDADHATGSKECEAEIKQQRITNIMNQEKVGFLRARQIYDDSTSDQTITFTPTIDYNTHFTLSVKAEEKRKIAPWVIEKSLENYLGDKPLSILTKDKGTFLIEVANKKQSQGILSYTDITPKYKGTIAIADKAIHRKGIAYIYEYNLDDDNEFERFRKEFIEHHKVIDVQKALWIRKKNQNQSQALIVTFHGEVPRYLTVPKEKSKVRIYEDIKRPYLCTKCQEYGHPKKFCREEKYICGRCSEEHETTECTVQTPKCKHCGKDHQTGNKSCIYYKREEGILCIQSRSKIPRHLAAAKFHTDNPNFTEKESYANIAKQTPKQQESSTRPTATSSKANNPKKTTKTTQKVALSSMPRTNNSFQLLSGSGEESIQNIARDVAKIVKDTGNKRERSGSGSRSKSSSATEDSIENARRKVHRTSSSRERNKHPSKPTSSSQPNMET